ncbi:unnamed protein product [marine sediment metagenome]|uniref:Uncharacterized protein n=1 Tax=marine sediment metagenome TaxID=412755 RepID=X0WTR8_9ZZZZ
MLKYEKSLQERSLEVKQSQNIADSVQRLAYSYKNIVQYSQI